MKGWDDLGVMVKPHFATAYPGSEWFTVYRKKIEEQYAGLGKKYGLTDDLEAYIPDLGMQAEYQLLSQQTLMELS